MKTKQELIEYEKAKLQKFISAIEKLPDDASELGYSYETSFDGAQIHKEIILESLKDELHKLREKYGNYKIDNYYIPFKGLVCVNYNFGSLRVWFSIRTDNEEEVISILSNNKCKIVEETLYKIECNIN